MHVTYAKLSENQQDNATSQYFTMRTACSGAYFLSLAGCWAADERLWELIRMLLGTSCYCEWQSFLAACSWESWSLPTKHTNSYSSQIS